MRSLQVAGFGTYPPAVVLLSLQECLSWGPGDSAFFQLGKTLTRDPCKNQNLKRSMYFIPWGGFLNDLGPNLVSDLPVIPLVWQERGHARASCAVRLSSPICRVARLRKDRVHTVLSEEKGTASPAARRGLVRLGQCGEEARESCQLVGQ